MWQIPVEYLKEYLDRNVASSTATPAWFVLYGEADDEYAGSLEYRGRTVDVEVAMAYLTQMRDQTTSAGYVKVLTDLEEVDCMYPAQLARFAT